MRSRILIAIASFAGAVLCSPIFASDNALLDPALKDGVGVGPFGMGGAQVAVASGDSALFYNPAGLAFPGVSYTYSNMDYKNAVYRENFSNLFYKNPVGIGSWRVSDELGNRVDVFAFGFGRRNYNGVSWGLTYKTVRSQTADGEVINGWSSDLGTQVLMTQNLQLGFAVQDALSQSVAVSPSLRSGLAFYNDDRGFVITGDFLYARPRSTGKTEISGRVGMEYILTEGLSVRAGWQKDYLTGGFTMATPIVAIDYALGVAQSSVQESVYMLGFRVGPGPVRENGQENNYGRQYQLFKQKAYAQFRLGENLVSGQSEISLLGGQKIGSNDLMSLVHQATIDPSCEGFLIRIGSVGSGLGSISVVQELRDSLKSARKAGKKVVVYLESWAGLSEYYLASAADRVVMPELASISNLGIDFQVTKSKKLFNKFGFNETIIASGVHKAALQPGGEPLSSEQRAGVEDVVHDLYHQILVDIKTDRSLNWDRISKAFDGRILSASEAKEMGLVDELGYWESAKLYAANAVGTSPNVVADDLLAFAPDPSPDPIFSPFSKRIAVLEIDGPISLGASSSNLLFGGKSTGADELDAVIDEIKKDGSIRAVLLRVNSPGGSLLASDRIYHSLGRIRKSGRLVYSSLGNVAASGGYYVALNSDKIYACPASLTGSIGVISTYADRSEFNRMLGIEVDSIKTSEHADMWSGNRPLTAQEKDMLMAHQKIGYDTFVHLLQINRKLSDAEATTVAQGQVFTGKQAKELKLVDQLGGFYDAVDGLSKDAGIEGRPQLVYYRPHPKWTFPSLGIDTLFRFFSMTPHFGRSEKTYALEIL